MINNTDKELIFLGTNSAIWYLVDTAKLLGITIAGIIDDDYHGIGTFQGLPVIAPESSITQSSYNNYQFFCATAWQPDDKLGVWHTRNREKRQKYINLLDDLNLDVATIVHPRASVVSYNVDLGKGVYVDNNVYVGSNSKIGNYSMLWFCSGIAHDNIIGKNCVVQRYCTITGGVQLQDNVFMGIRSSVVRDDVVISEGSFIHPGITMLRGTQKNEIVSLAGKDLRKIYNNPTVS